MQQALYQTAAFISAGMHADIPRLDDAREILGTGTFELVSSAIQYTEFAAMLYQAGWLMIGEVPGVFDYEVCEEFGTWYVNFVHMSGQLPSSKHACQKLIDLAVAFFMRIDTVRDTKGAEAALRAAFGRIDIPEQPEC